MPIACQPLLPTLTTVFLEASSLVFIHLGLAGITANVCLMKSWLVCYLLFYFGHYLLFLALLLMSRSCFLDPLNKLLTLPIAHCAIPTPGRLPAPKKAPCPLRYTALRSARLKVFDFCALALNVLSVEADNGLLLFTKFHPPVYQALWYSLTCLV